MRAGARPLRTAGSADSIGARAEGRAFKAEGNAVKAPGKLLNTFSGFSGRADANAAGNWLKSASGREDGMMLPRIFVATFVGIAAKTSEGKALGMMPPIGSVGKAGRPVKTSSGLAGIPDARAAGSSLKIFAGSPEGIKFPRALVGRPDGRAPRIFEGRADGINPPRSSVGRAAGRAL